jgi:membrane protease YdiL (CAAX protease family)
MSVRDDFLPNLSTKNFILIFVGTLGLVLVAVMTFALMNDGRYHINGISESALYVTQDYVYVILIFFGVYLFGHKIAKLTWRDIGFRPCPSDWMVRAFILGIFVYSIRILADNAFVVWFGVRRMREPGQTDLAIINEATPSTVIAFIIVVSLLTPLATEIFQRGILFPWLRRNFNFMMSAIASAFIFGALHIELVRYAQILVFGVAAAYLYEKSRSLWPPLAFHMTINCAYLVGLMSNYAQMTRLP